MPTPLMIATRCSANVFMKMPRSRWLMRSENWLRTSTSSMSSTSFTLRGVRRLEVLDHALHVVAEVAAVVVLGALAGSAAPGSEAAVSFRFSSTSAITAWKKPSSVHALQVGEHGEEPVFGALVRLQRLLQMVEERRLPDAALARDHQAVVVQHVQDAREQLLAAEEHLLGHDRRARDVGVEAALHRAPPARALDRVAEPDQRHRARDRGGQEGLRLVEAQAAVDVVGHARAACRWRPPRSR